MIKKSFSFEEADFACKILSNVIMLNHNITHIVSIGRGGYVPARLFSKFLDIRTIYNFGVKAYTEDGKKGTLDYYQPLTNTFQMDDVILLVDDIVDSGETLQSVKKYLMTNNACQNIITCSLHTKKDASIRPTYTGFIINDPETWIVYDWE